MKFDIYGHFPIPREGKTIVLNAQSRKKFWREVGDMYCKPDLPDSHGCYVFAIKAAKGYTPFYVGKADTSSFRQEVLNPYNIEKYNNVLIRRKSGTPILFLLPRVTDAGNFGQVTTKEKPAIGALEDMLIARAIRKNKNAQNISGTKMLREIVVHGFMNSGRGKHSAEASELQKVFKIPKVSAK